MYTSELMRSSCAALNLLMFCCQILKRFGYGNSILFMGKGLGVGRLVVVLSCGKPWPALWLLLMVHACGTGPPELVKHGLGWPQAPTGTLEVAPTKAMAWRIGPRRGLGGSVA